MAEFNREDTYIKVIDIVALKLSIDKNTITKEATFQDLGADSLNMVEIVMRLEEVFGIEIDDDSAEKFTDLRQAIDYIHSKRTK